MSTLFTISASWHEHTWLYEQLAYASQGDAILLLEDAVFALQSPVVLASFVAKCQALDVDTYALLDDIQQRGIDVQYDSFKQVDYQGMVELLVKYNKQVAW